MGRDRDPGVKRGGMAGLRRKKGGKEGFENPYCGPSVQWHLFTPNELVPRSDLSIESNPY